MLGFRLDTFAGYTDTDFRVMEGTSVLCTLRLAEVSNYTRTLKQETFSLLFLGPLDVFLEQGTRRLRHETLGEFELILVPLGKNDAGFQYEAVFNLLLGPA